MNRVSIIVPVYKVEKYLERCVRSLQNQTVQNIEIILVDDGSPDNCPEMCEQLALEDSRIKVVHKQNGGLSSARNAGLAVATGKYVGFVDSDDDVDPRMYELMIQTIERENVDFVMVDYIRMNDKQSYLKTTSLEGGIYNRQDITKKIFPALIMNETLEYGPLLSVWHCIYKRSFLKKHHLQFDEEIRWSEDNLFSALVGYYAQSFYYLKGKGLYHYYENPGTITTGYRKNCWDVYSLMNRRLADFFSKVKDYDFSAQLKIHAIFYACNSIGNVKQSGESIGRQLEMVKNIMQSPLLKETFTNFVFPKSWSLKLKLQIFLIKHELSWLYYKLILR